jgi:hypothetical protein
MDKKIIIALSVAMPVLTVSCGQTENKENNSVENPNIIFVMVDDMGYGDLGCYGQKEIKTPNIDHLASEGIRFTNFYSGSPVCAPARSVLMTGNIRGIQLLEEILVLEE